MFIHVSLQPHSLDDVIRAQQHRWRITVPATCRAAPRWLIFIARPILLGDACRGNSRRRAAPAQQRGDLGLAAELRPAQDRRLILVVLDAGIRARSEERRVGKECRSRWSPY